MSCLDSLLVYSAGKLQALELIVLVVFGAVYYHLPHVGWSIFGNQV